MIACWVIKFVLTWLLGWWKPPSRPPPQESRLGRPATISGTRNLYKVWRFLGQEILGNNPRDKKNLWKVWRLGKIFVTRNLWKYSQRQKVWRPARISATRNLGKSWSFAPKWKRVQQTWSGEKTSKHLKHNLFVNVLWWTAGEHWSRLNQHVIVRDINV